MSEENRMYRWRRNRIKRFIESNETHELMRGEGATGKRSFEKIIESENLPVDIEVVRKNLYLVRREV